MKRSFFFIGGIWTCSLIFLFSRTLPQKATEESVTADTLAYGLLIPASATMQRAWEIPRNPFADPVPAKKKELIRYGYRVFTRTQYIAKPLSGNSMACSNCHLNAGQREKGLPLVGVSAAYPSFNGRAGRVVTLKDRIVGCFSRSLDATRLAREDMSKSTIPGGQLENSREVNALAEYLTWLSEGIADSAGVPWRGQNTIPDESRIPVGKLDKVRGKTLYIDRCSTCHGKDGQGVFIGDKKAGPLWGDESWNDGAGAARIYTLAGMIRYMMPYLDPGSLTDEEAQDIAAFIDSQRRPVYPFKAQDYPGGHAPSDAVYYAKELKK